MTAPSDDDLRALRREVEGLLGRCLLRFQHCERLLKLIVSHHEISGPADTLEKARTARAIQTSGKTMGNLRRDILRSFLVSGETDDSDEDLLVNSEVAPSVSFRMTLNFPEEDFDRIETELKEFVDLRNDLVHHFIDQHDLHDLDGCRGARDALIAADGRIDHHLGQVSGWAGDLRESFRLMAEALNSEEFLGVVLSDAAPDGPGELAVPNPQKQN